MKSKVIKNYRSKWRKIELPEPVKTIGGMTSFDEKRLLYDASVKHFKNIGCIVDAGCFLGGPTMCLGYGLKDKINTQVIHAYDTFVVDEGQHKHHSSEIPEYKVGSDFLHLFNQTTKEISHLIKTHQGNIFKQPVPDKEIEIFFIDIAKTPFINDYIVRKFFPLLIPNHSLVIHQDYIWNSTNGWIHSTMEYLSEYFEMVDIVDSGGSVVFQLKKAIPAEKLQDVFFARSREEALYLQIQAIKKFKGNQEQKYLLNQSHEDLTLKIDNLHKAYMRSKYPSYF